MNKGLVLVTSQALCAIIGIFFLPSPQGLTFETNTEHVLLQVIAIMLFVNLFNQFRLQATERRNEEDIEVKMAMMSLGCFFIGAFVFHFFGVIFGAPILYDIEPTFLWALFMSNMTFVTICIISGANLEVLSRLILDQKPTSMEEKIVCLPSLVSIFFSWLGAFVIPLDWDRPWQKWPIPCIYSSVIGYSIGVLIVLIFSLTHRLKQE